MVFTLPNFITVIRIILVPVFLKSALQTGELNIPEIVFILSVSALSDFLDGYIARKYNLTSKTGAVLDPFADKLMQSAVLFALFKHKWIPLWLLLFVCIKEIIICAGAAILIKNKIDVRAKAAGKAATIIFYIAAFIMVLFEPTGILSRVIDAVIIISAVYALASYSELFIKNIFKRKEQNG